MGFLDILKNKKQDEPAVASEEILEGVLRFANTETANIMRPRIEVTGVDITANFDELKKIFINSGYSRIPVYKDNLDSIEGIFYIKDILPYLNEPADFEWTKLTRPTVFVTENEPIDLVLKKMQAGKMHIAVVVDEYGGTSGIVTLEDILEELVGDIADEADTKDDAHFFKKINDNTFLIDARIPLHDFCKIFHLEDNFFEQHDGEFESLAGLILEKLQRIPEKGESIEIPPFTFTVEELDARRISVIKVNNNSHTL
ncbi:MAG: CBS domain-containing protein [Bacteroidales bacterium]|jgi:CBS domain containing-hemolysin-like protein|nr:CBS domain-containing protein [Bacteroidales bacterium]